MATFLELIARQAAIDLSVNYHKNRINYDCSYNIFKNIIRKFGNNKIEIISKDEYKRDLSSIIEGRKEFKNIKLRVYIRYTNLEHFINSTNLFLNFVNKDTSENRKKLWDYLNIPYKNDLLEKKFEVKRCRK